MKISPRTDLACEANADLSSIEGTKYSIKDGDIYIVESLDILSDSAARRLSRRKGRYVTLSTPRLQFLEDGDLSLISYELSQIIRSMLLLSTGLEKLNPEVSVLVVGLGNANITADAIGPSTVNKITVTRHLSKRAPSYFSILNRCHVSALSPDVIGKTGIESAETVKAVIDRIHPDAIIAIDALAARSVERLARTFQVSDTGITPGEGVGNIGSELSIETLGIPVISLGVPTVVDTTTLALDILESVGIKNFSDDLTKALSSSENFFVTPKETDVIIENATRLLADAIDAALVISE